MYKLDSNPARWTDDELTWLFPFVDAKVLGLGEAAHTSDGFYSTKVRLIQYLIQHHNYRAISFETPWGKALSATDFIQTGKGNADTALKGLFRVWRARSVENLLLWLRKWNAEHPEDQVRFFGNDAQQPDWDLNYLLNSRLVSAFEKSELRTMFNTMFGSGIFFERYAASEEFKKLMTQGFAENQDLTSQIIFLLKSLSLEKNTHEYAARISLSSYVLDTSKNVHGTVKNLVHLRGEAFAHRDECMSDLTLHFAGDEKTILWAHNYHVSRPSEKLVDGIFYQGQFLKKALNEKYKAIGLTASRIDINWPWLPENMRGRPSLPANSLEKAVTNYFPNQSIFLTSIENIECANYCQDFNFSQDNDISARFDGLIVLPESGPVEYATTLE